MLLIPLQFFSWDQCVEQHNMWWGLHSLRSCCSHGFLQTWPVSCDWSKEYILLSLGLYINGSRALIPTRSQPVRDHSAQSERKRALSSL